MLNLKVRFKNPVFIAQLILSVLTPIYVYYGLTAQDITSWGKLFDLIIDAISNPYVVSLIAVSLWNAINDPTTRGMADSERAKTYNTPR